MRLAYVLLVHKNPEQVSRLVHALANEGASFWIHVDERAGDVLYSRLNELLADVPNTHFVERRACYWGDLGIIQATLIGVRALVRSRVDFDRAILLSGQDYPIQSIDHLESFFRKHPDKEFIESFPLASQNRWSDQAGSYQALNRVSHWHFRVRSRIFRVPVPRRFPTGFVPHGGSQWWCLTRDCVRYVDRFVEEHPSFVSFFKNTFIPDELFFQNVISNSPFASSVVSDDLRFIDWDNPNPGAPATMLKGDFGRLSQSSKLFARKFDASRDSDIFDMIDARILGIGPENAETDGAPESLAG